MRVALVLAASLSVACGIPYGGDFGSPRWDADGAHVFYLEQRFIMAPHPYEYFRLWRGLPDKSDDYEIDSGAIYDDSGSLSPSPDGRYLLYVRRSVGQGSRLVVYDVAAEREALQIEFASRDEDPLSIIWPTHAGWRPDGRAIYYSDGDGIEVAPLDGPRQLLVPHSSGSASGVGWSPDGRFLYHATGNGWPRGNQLRVLEVATGADREVGSFPTGLIGNVVFSPTGDRFAFPVYLIDGKTASILVAPIGGVPGELARVPAKWAEDLAWAAQPETLLLTVQRDDVGAVLACVGPDRVVRRVNGDRLASKFGWDYHRGTNRLVWTGADHADFATADLAGCAAPLPEL